MSITAANAAFSLSIVGVFPAPISLEQFAADDIFDNDNVRPAEVQQGVDGVAAAGFIYNLFPQKISFMANSPSVDVFDQWYYAQKALQDIYAAVGVVALPGVKKKWSLINGTLTQYTPMPSAGKILKPRQFEITWQDMIPVPFG